MRLRVAVDDHVLEQIAERRFDGAFVLGLHLEVVGEGAALADRRIGAREQHPRAVAEGRPRAFDLLEREQAGAGAGEIVFALALLAFAPLVFDAGRRQLTLAFAAGDLRRGELALRLTQRARRAVASLDGTGQLAIEIAGLDIETAHHGRGAFALGRRMVDGGRERRHRVHHGVDLGAGLLNRALDGGDRLLRLGVGLGRGGRGIGGVVARAFGFGNGGAALFEPQALRLAAVFERLTLGVEFADARLQHRRLLGVERELLLAPVDVEFAGVRGFADARGILLGLREFDAHARQFGFHFGQTGRRTHFVLSGVVQARARRFDVFGEVAVAPREQHLLPAPHLVAQPLVAAGLAGLALERAALLLDFEDDVVEARQVLLCRVELEFGGAAAGLVLGDAGRFFDELTAVGRPRAQDHPDLALLDDRVGLGAEPGVHQELVHVAQAALRAVDEVLALARAVQAARDLDVAHGLHRVGEQDLGGGLAVTVQRRLVAVGRCGRRHRHTAQSQPHLSSARGLPGVAAAEDDVFHLVAAEALGALLAEHPRQRVGDVALPTAVRPDDGRDATVEGQLRPIGEGFEPGNLKAIETHGYPRGEASGARDYRRWTKLRASLAGPYQCGKTIRTPQHFGVCQNLRGGRDSRLSGRRSGWFWPSSGSGAARLWGKARARAGPAGRPRGGGGGPRPCRRPPSRFQSAPWRG